MGRLRVKKNFMTVPAAIKELEKIEMVRFGDGRYKLEHAVTKNQRLIMESFGIDTEYLLRQVALVAATLSSQT